MIELNEIVIRSKMTEQEVFNNPEMKTITLLSGYVRELGEGKDYETTTYKLAETLVKVFTTYYVNQQREQLRAFREWTRENLDQDDIVTQKAIDSYLESL